MRIPACLLSLLFAAPALAQTGPVTRFTIPRTAQPPTIDGHIGDDEWRQATLLGGVSHTGGPDQPLHPRATRFYLSWDADNLYVAGRSEVLPNERLLMTVRDRDSQSVVYDDSYEFGFDPKGRNAGPGEVPAAYKLLVNFFGRTGPLKTMPSIGAMSYTWSPRLKVGSAFSPDHKWWDLEMAVPARSLEQPRGNVAGDAFGLLLGRNYKTPWNQTAVPGMASGYFDPVGWLQATLTDAQPFVQLAGLEGEPRGRAACTVVARNPGADPAQVEVRAEWSGGEGLARRQTLEVPAGGEASFMVDEPLPAEKGSLRVMATAGEASLLDFRAAYQAGYGREEMPADTEPLAARTFPFQAGYNPVRSLLWLEGDTMEVPQSALAKSLRWTVTGTSGNDVAQGKIDRLYFQKYQDLVSLPDLPPGRYTVSASLLDADGKPLANASAPISRVDEKAKYPWLGNDLGRTDRIIPPYTPIAVKGNALSVWGRTYTLGGLGLPLSMVSRGGELLAEPVRIVVVLHGKEVVVPMAGQPQIGEQHPWLVRYTGEAKAVGLRFTLTGSLEQDGAMLDTLTYQPAGKAVRVDALRLEYPLRADNAELMACMGAGGNFAAKTTGAVPPGTGRVWSTLELGRQASQMTVGTFFPQLWVGNDQRGLVWWADNDQGWFPDDAVPAHEVLRQGESVIVRNNLIGVPTTLYGPHTVAFTLNATPHKRLPPGWRLTVWSDDGAFENREAGERGYKNDRTTGVNGWNLLQPPSRDPKDWPAIFDNYRQHAEQRLRDLGNWNAHRGGDYLSSSIPIVGYGHLSLDDETYRYFGAEWNDSLNPSMADYYLSLMHDWVEKGGLRMWYLDITFPHLDDSLLNGLAYRLPDGRTQPGYSLSNMRRFYMRLYAMMSGFGDMPGGVVGHGTNDYPFAVLPWMDAMLDGEAHVITDDSPFDWVDGYPEQRLRALSDSHAWGTVINWMSLVKTTDAARTAAINRGKRGWLMLHDVWSVDFEPCPIQGVWNWGLSEDRVRFTPYWRSDGLIGPGAPGLKASVWQLPGKVMVEFFNEDKAKPVAVDATLDLTKLGLLPLDPLRHRLGAWSIDGPAVANGQQFDAATGRLHGFSVGPRDFCIVAVHRY